MRLNIFRTIIISGLTLFVAASCSRPKSTESEGGASAGGGSVSDQPVIADKTISSDPMGSDSGNITGLSSIYFEYDQARLTAEARKQLEQNAEWIKSNPKFTIQIEGHTDSRGSVEYNLSLGERRAKSVKAHLEGLGVESRRMTIISYGEEKPLLSGDSESDWAKNRRANFVPIQ